MVSTGNSVETQGPESDERTPPLQLRRSDWGLAGISLAIIFGSLVVFRLFGHPPQIPPRAETGELAEQVALASVEISHEPVEVKVQGVVRPFRHVSVATEVAGRIRFKSDRCQEATYVQQGELLFEIDPTDYEIAVRRVTQELKQTENSLEEWQVERNNVLEQIKLSEQDVELAERDQSRLERLFQSDGTTQASLDQAKRAVITARNTLLGLNNQLRLLDARYDRAVSARDLQKVELERAERDLARTKIVAPCHGTIVTENVEQDGYAQAGATMMVINDTSAAEVACQLEMDDMLWLWGTKTSLGEATPSGPSVVRGTDATNVAEFEAKMQMYEFPRWPVTIEFPLQDLICEWPGELVRFGGTGVDPATRTVPCQVHVANPLSGKLLHADGSAEANLLPPPLTVGMFVTVRAQIKPHTPLLEISNDALHAGSVVWVAREGKLRIVPVKVARRLDKSVLIYSQPDVPSSLQAGEQVIVSPLALPQEGMLVTEVPAA